MALALEFGLPIGQLELMPEAEFVRWMRYSMTKGLPSRRVEIYLAQIAFWIARTMGGVGDKTIADYLLDQADEVPIAEGDELEQAEAALNFQPRNKKE